MTMEQQHYKTIDRYLARNEGLPLVVDVQNKKDLKKELIVLIYILIQNIFG